MHAAVGEALSVPGLLHRGHLHTIEDGSTRLIPVPGAPPGRGRFLKLRVELRKNRHAEIVQSDFEAFDNEMDVMVGMHDVKTQLRRLCGRSVRLPRTLPRIPHMVITGPRVSGKQTTALHKALNAVGLVNGHFKIMYGRRRGFERKYSKRLAECSFSMRHTASCRGKRMIR